MPVHFSPLLCQLKCYPHLRLLSSWKRFSSRITIYFIPLWTLQSFFPSCWEANHISTMLPPPGWRARWWAAWGLILTLYVLTRVTCVSTHVIYAWAEQSCHWGVRCNSRVTPTVTGAFWLTITSDDISLLMLCKSNYPPSSVQPWQKSQKKTNKQENSKCQIQYSRLYTGEDKGDSFLN